MSFYTVVTDSGVAKQAAAIAGGSTVDLIQIAVGDGSGNPITPLASMTALVNEVYRGSIPAGGLKTDPANPNWISTQITVPLEEGGWTAREVGLFDADGDLFALGSFPETYKPLPEEGAARELTITMLIELSNTGVVTLIAENANTVTPGFVDQQMTDHEDNNHHATRGHIYFMGQM